MAATYSIVRQVERTDIQPGGALVPVIDVTFIAHPSEQTGTVTMPRTQYSAEKVAELAAAHAKLLNDIQAQ